MAGGVTAGRCVFLGWTSEAGHRQLEITGDLRQHSSTTETPYQGRPVKAP